MLDIIEWYKKYTGLKLTPLQEQRLRDNFKVYKEHKDDELVIGRRGWIWIKDEKIRKEDEKRG